MTQILNSLIEEWAESLIGDPKAKWGIFYAPGTTDFTDFLAAASDAVRVDHPLIFWPRSLRLDGTDYMEIDVPTCHLFAATKLAANTLRLACQSECDRVIHRVLALNPSFRGGPLTVQRIPSAISTLHARKPHSRYRPPA